MSPRKPPGRRRRAGDGSVSGDRSRRERFAVEIHSFGSDAVLVLDGDLDAVAQSRLEAAFARVGDGYTRIVLDLSEVTLIDAAGVGLIHRAQRVTASRGVELVFRSPDPRVGRALESAGVGSAPSAEAPRPIALPLPSRVYEHTSSSGGRPPE